MPVVDRVNLTPDSRPLVNVMKKNEFSLKYPRRVLFRKGMKSLSKLLIMMLTEIKISGKENLPNQGPMILAGNHVATLEAVMMAAYTPGIVEFVGTGDIPFDPNYAVFANAYGLIPINRGSLDRKGLKMGLDVLAQDGIIGIFPEGGTWDPANMSAQIGVALLSYRAQVPILPIGFGGVKGSLEKALKLKHPALQMNVGELMAPVALEDHNLPLKANLQKAADQVMKKINALIPDEDIRLFQRRVDEVHRLEIKVLDHDQTVALPEELIVRHGEAYARFLYNPTIMDVLARNLHLPIKPIKLINHEVNLRPLLKAWRSILDYLEINPGYFTYRFGVAEGLAMKKALQELHRLGEWVCQSGYAITIQPIRRYRNSHTGAAVIERGGCFPESM